MNDIETCKPEMGDIKLFADDTAIMIKHENLNTLNELGNLAMRNTHYWLTMNKQSLIWIKYLACIFLPTRREMGSGNQK